MWRYIPVFLILLLWQTIGSLGALPNYILPTPVAIFQGLVQLTVSGIPPGHLLQYHIIFSLYRVAWGFSLACLLGIPLGLLMGWFPIFRQLISPMIELLRPIPPLAWIPIAIVWLGIGIKSAAFIIFLGAFFPILLNTASGVMSVNPILIDVARTMNANQKDIFLKVLIPGSLPSMFVGLRIGMGVSWMTLVAAEFSGIKNGYGLGFMIMTARDLQKTDQILAGMLVIGLIGFIIDKIFKYGESRLRPQHRGDQVQCISN